MLDWNVAVYCANEGPRLRRCLERVAAALSGSDALITVILNGSTDGSRDVALAAARAGLPLEVFEIAAADKSNAINQFNHGLRSPARGYAGVDGNVFVGAGTFRAMAGVLGANGHAMALAGIAINGRTEARRAGAILAAGGSLTGQLHGVRPDFLDRMVSRGIRLPVGLYRGDGLLGSMAAHNLDPLTEPWDNARIPGVAEATYEIKSLSVFKPGDLRRQFRRKVRQMRGVMENQAVKAIIQAGGYEALPGNADDMIRDHLAAHGVPPAAFADRPFQRLALRDHARARPPAPADLVPRRIAP